MEWQNHFNENESTGSFTDEQVETDSPTKERVMEVEEEGGCPLRRGGGGGGGAAGVRVGGGGGFPLAGGSEEREGLPYVL